MKDKLELGSVHVDDNLGCVMSKVVLSSIELDLLGAEKSPYE